jgi:hypothetical protein
LYEAAQPPPSVRPPFAARISKGVRLPDSLRCLLLEHNMLAEQINHSLNQSMITKIGKIVLRLNFIKIYSILKSSSEKMQMRCIMLPSRSLLLPALFPVHMGSAQYVFSLYFPLSLVISSLTAISFISSFTQSIIFLSGLDLYYKFS